MDAILKNEHDVTLRAVTLDVIWLADAQFYKKENINVIKLNSTSFKDDIRKLHRTVTFW